MTEEVEIAEHLHCRYAKLQHKGKELVKFSSVLFSLYVISSAKPFWGVRLWSAIRLIEQSRHLWTNNWLNSMKLKFTHEVNVEFLEYTVNKIWCLALELFFSFSGNHDHAAVKPDSPPQPQRTPAGTTWTHPQPEFFLKPSYFTKRAQRKPAVAGTFGTTVHWQKHIQWRKILIFWALFQMPCLIIINSKKKKKKRLKVKRSFWMCHFLLFCLYWHQFTESGGFIKPASNK